MNYFLTEAYLTSNGYFNENIDSSLYLPLIEGVAKAFLPSQIGTYFFNDLVTKYDLQTLSSDEEIVVDLIQKSLANRLKAETAMEATYQLTNKGLQKQDSDNSTSLEMKEVGVRVDGLLSRAIQYELEIKEWLHENKDLYPIFIDVLNKNSSIKKCINPGYIDGSGGIILI